jgi:hypothetical protein
MCQKLVQNVIDGLTILNKYEDNNINALEGEVLAGPCVKVSPAERYELVELGWRYDKDIKHWTYQV